MLALLLTAALATEPVPSPPPDAAATPIEPAAWSPRRRLDEGWVRVGRGDGEGARMLADEVAARTDDPVTIAEAAYLRGVIHQLLREHDEALHTFEAVVDGAPHPFVLDARFRIALVQLDIDAPRDALRTVKRLRRDAEVGGTDALKLDLVEATAKLELGRSRRGARALADLVERPDVAPLTWFVARAHHALLHDHLDEAARLDLSRAASSKARTRQRIEHLQSAESVAEALVGLPEAWFQLDAVHSLARGWSDFADALEAAPPPARLSDEQRVHYREALAPQVASLRIKALQLADAGRDLAGRIGWRGDEVAALDALLAELTATLEAQP